MFDVSGRTTAIRLSILAGAAALAMGGLTATAEAFPATAATPAAGMAATAVQYRGDGHPHHMRRHHHGRFGANSHPHHPGYAGLYDCGPGGVRTRLSRKACGGNNRFQHLQQAY